MHHLAARTGQRFGIDVIIFVIIIVCIRNKLSQDTIDAGIVIRRGRTEVVQQRTDFGFLVPTHESLRLGDILIRGDVIRKSPEMTTEPGTKVRCSVASAAGKGYRAVAVQEIIQPVRFSRFLRATVKWYRRDFGFLVAAGHPDIFIHASVLKRAGMPPLRQDDQVLVRVAGDEHGRRRAVAVRPVPLAAC